MAHPKLYARGLLKDDSRLEKHDLTAESFVTLCSGKLLCSHIHLERGFKGAPPPPPPTTNASEGAAGGAVDRNTQRKVVMCVATVGRKKKPQHKAKKSSLSLDLMPGQMKSFCFSTTINTVCLHSY